LSETRTQIAARAAIKAFTELVETAAATARPPVRLPPFISLSLKDASAYTGVKISRLRQAIHERELPARLAGKKHVVLVEDLRDFVRSLPFAWREE
jgi:hypothetical protein